MESDRDIVALPGEDNNLLFDFFRGNFGRSKVAEKQKFCYAKGGFCDIVIIRKVSSVFLLILRK